jgi:sugar O-acyltransferase (sialic acid O-acetyltransferase NeuD family)
MKDIAIFGAGGFGREIACLINRINEKQEGLWNLIGFFDDDEKLKDAWNEYGKVWGGMDVLNHWDKPLDLVIAIGNPAILEELVGKIRNPNITYPNLIDPNVEFMDREHVEMGKGNVICMRSTISTNVKFGNFNLLNVAVGMGHDAALGNFNVVMPNVNISGGVTIGSGNLFGVKSTVLQYLKVGDRVKIGASALLMRNAKSDNLYFGIPAEKK